MCAFVEHCSMWELLRISELRASKNGEHRGFENTYTFLKANEKNVKDMTTIIPWDMPSRTVCSTPILSMYSMLDEASDES